MNSETDISHHGMIYKKNILNICYEFLQNSYKTKESRDHFINRIREAQIVFENYSETLGKETLQMFAYFITNTILILSGIALIAFPVNKFLTGDWLFFNCNRATSIIRTVSQDVADSCNFSSL